MNDPTLAPINRPTYEQMVRDLFKKMPGHGSAMLHAAIGIAGETGEIRDATTRANLTEECGDMEFYIEAGWQSMTTPINRLDAYTTIERRPADPRSIGVTPGNVVNNLHSLSSDLLDHAKKVWVYEDGNRDAVIAELLLKIEFNLMRLYDFHGFTRDYIRRCNQDKLLGNEKIRGRYATGKYSNEQALARADKQPEVQRIGDEDDGDHGVASGNVRNFIGQKKS